MKAQKTEVTGENQRAGVAAADLPVGTIGRLCDDFYYKGLLVLRTYDGIVSLEPFGDKSIGQKTWSAPSLRYLAIEPLPAGSKVTLS